jgi:hypothetical protein
LRVSTVVLNPSATLSTNSSNLSADVETCDKRRARYHQLPVEPTYPVLALQTRQDLEGAIDEWRWYTRSVAPWRIDGRKIDGRRIDHRRIGHWFREGIRNPLRSTVRQFGIAVNRHQEPRRDGG